MIDATSELNTKTIFEKHISSDNLATYIFCMLVEDKVASSVASYIPIINKQTNLNKPLSKLKEVVSPEVIKY